MSKHLLLQSLLRHDRVLVILGLLLVVSLAWGYLWAGAGMTQEMGGTLMPMSPGHWTIGTALLMFVMWAVMMTAMMLPSAAPAILLYATISRGKGKQTRRGGSGVVFAAGYFCMWVAFSILAVALQFIFEKTQLISPMMVTTGANVAAVILVASGVYQLTPLKQSCLKKCRSPLDFIVANWREGRIGAFLMGAHHGLYCVGCCWMLMLLLFVGGVMNIVWIGGLAIFVLIEKLAPAGQWVGRLGGMLLIAAGVSIALSAT